MGRKILRRRIWIAKSPRRKFCWVAVASQSASSNGIELLTLDTKKMKEVPNHVEEDQNICDIFGLSATEEIFTFRCYRRKLMQGVVPTKRRRLHPFISASARRAALVFWANSPTMPASERRSAGRFLQTTQSCSLRRFSPRLKELNGCNSRRSLLTLQAPTLCEEGSGEGN